MTNLAQRAVGCVVIGRNEGARLQSCLRSLVGRACAVVYVDSGSTDGSTEFARSQGVEVVELDMTQPFTAARARNAGFARLMDLHPELQFVQFVDGDCEVVPHWLERAAEVLSARSDLAVVCGRRRERYPETSIYNRLCDMEWDTPIGSARACGGDALMRVSTYARVGGFNPDLIAGEEPELCIRLRATGLGVERLDLEMTLHDAAMLRFGQWWQRSVRAGHAYAEGAHLHGAPPERHWVREVRRCLFWGALLPLVALLLAPWTYGLSLLLFGAYLLTTVRGYQSTRRAGHTTAHALQRALFLTLGKFPECQGALRYYWGRLARKRSSLIEYKQA